MANLLKNGKTLKQARDEILARTEKTGHYNGLKKLEFKERDPIGYEKMFSKLRGGIVHARETAKRIAASPIVEQEGELCFTLYNAVGDSVLTSTGIIIHVGTMGSAIKYMVENNWEDNPGINDKDIFTNNDCAIGNVHPCDIMTLVPIFHDEKLIGWVGGVTHVIDTGSVTPGSMSTGQVQRFGDGYMITCRKTGANDESFKDWLHESQRSVRTPKYWILDERTRIAGCHMIRDLVMEVIKEDGIDSYMRFIDEVIEEGRRGLISRIKSMTIPGKYRKVAFVDVPYAHKDIGVCSEFAKLDTIMHSPVEITINKDATWKLDFDGASRWGWHSFNCNQVSFTSGIWVMMTQTLIPTSRINDGAYFATQFRLKKGTWMNPEGDMGDVEIWEMAEPLLYLGRNVKANTGGYGKYRGGNGFETLRMVWGAHDWTMFFMGNGYMNSDWGMMGGYPAASGYRFEAHNTDLENRIKNNASLPLGGDFNPTDRDYEKHISHASQVKRDKQCITTENCFDNYDLYLNYIKGGPGFGDPIERDLNAILEDLNSKQLLPEYAYKVYGAVVSQNKDGIWVGDEAKTKARRKEILENRKARSIPVKEWMEQERNAILEKEASKQVKHMYATSFDLSPKFLNDFKTFWNLPKSWSVKEDELGVFTYGSKYRMDLSKLPDVRTVLLVDEK